ncbi:MAG: thioredoxin domain-containing protein [Steroidobacterales bacterium]
MTNAHRRATPNRLAAQRSPYLRQHAGNPVDWYEWGPQALERACSERKPILLSIGYAACHWCHVMAHESFEDDATAALMNALFVNIKVDREERPDLDRIYQLAHQVLTRRGGGWPLTMFLMHEDQRPFFGGTYFPAEARFGLPAFRDLLTQVAAYYREHFEELRAPAAQITAALNDLNPPAAAAAQLSAAPILACRIALARDFDGRHGGFGSAPKFPHAPAITRLLHDWRASASADVPDLQALYMATLTLTRMAEGGLTDQLGGGFYRYSVDERWEIPHFEKMLYDNAQLLGAYAQAACATGEPLFRDCAERTAAWMMDDMRSPEGAFYSSLDADSEGHEGRYYLWNAADAQQHLTPQEWALFAPRFGLDAEPNFEGQWHLRVQASLESLSQAQRLPAEEIVRRLAAARARLLAVRAHRVRPGLDDKVLTSWNALAIRALAQAGRLLERPDFIAAAEQGLEYLRRRHWRGGRLFASDSTGTAALPAYLDDHVFLAEAVLELASARFRADELRFACELMDLVLHHFQDHDAGGFYFTADDHEALICRPKSYGDEALPAGNAIAAAVLLRLGHLLGSSPYLHAAERCLAAAWAAIERFPTGHTSMLHALQDYLHPPAIVLLRGPQAALTPWQRQLNALYAPRDWLLAVPAEAGELPAAIASKPATDVATAYVCRGSSCSAPIATLAALIDQLTDN